MATAKPKPKPDSPEKRSKRLLFAVASFLWQWQKDNAGNTDLRCLEAVRHACKEAGLKLPMSNVDYKGKLALTCGTTLAKNPKKWGWKLLGESASALPTDRPCLVFFKNCGLLPDRRVAGHVAIFKPSTAHIVANTTYNWSAKWAEKVAYVFEVA